MENSGTRWHTSAPWRTDITPASGAVSARVRLGIRRATDSDLNPISVHFDNVSLAPAGTIWIDGFERGTVCRWSAAVN